MIIAGKPELGLQPHQQEAYAAVIEAYKTGNRASVVIPTGCGKSFISLQLMMDNKDKRMLFLAPTEAIKSQMYRYIAKYIAGEEPSKKRPAVAIAEEYFPNLKIILYPALLRMKTEVMEKLNPDIIMMDELHRTGADKWGEKIDTLLSLNPNAKVLGLTATPDRMDDKNVVDELFNGNISYELTLVEAIRKRIVQAPSYVKCDYALSEHLEDIKTAIENCTDLKTKKELEEKYEKMRRIVEQADGIPELFAKHLTKKDGKYIVFCKDKEHMDELMEVAKQWFAEIDTEPEMYSVYSGDGKKKNQETIRQFEDSKSEHLKLLFSLDMLNEGLHVEDISGAIMLRPTESRIIYLQQLGRTLSSDTSREKTIVFDLVNNYLKNNLDAEINEDRDKRGGREPQGKNDDDRDDGMTDYIHDVIDIFRIQGETKEFLTLLEETNNLLGVSTYLRNMRAITSWMKSKESNIPPNANSKDKEERKLGYAYSRVKHDLINPYRELKTDSERDEFIQKYPEINEIIELADKIDANYLPIHLRNMKKIVEWMKNHERKPRQDSKDKEESKLADALTTIRMKLINPYLKLKTEGERANFRQEHPEVEEIISLAMVIDVDYSVHLKNARRVDEWMKRKDTTILPSINSNDEDEKNIAMGLKSTRHAIVNPYLKLKTEEEREKFRQAHPETDSVLLMVSEFESYGNSKRKVLALLIREDLEKRRKLQQARELEKSYKAEIDKLQENEQDKQKEGDNIGE